MERLRNIAIMSSLITMSACPESVTENTRGRIGELNGQNRENAEECDGGNCPISIPVCSMDK